MSTLDWISAACAIASIPISIIALVLAARAWWLSRATRRQR